MMKMVAFFRKTRMTNKKEQRIEAVALRCEGGKKKRESEVDEMRRSAQHRRKKKKHHQKKKASSHRRKLRQGRVGDREHADPVAVLGRGRRDRVEVARGHGEDGGVGSWWRGKDFFSREKESEFSPSALPLSRSPSLRSRHPPEIESPKHTSSGVQRHLEHLHRHRLVQDDGVAVVGQRDALR